MFKRNKNDKGKKSQEARMNISRALRGKAKKIRAKASTVARKGIIKGAEGAGYATARAGTEVATRPNVAKVVGKGLSALDKVASKLPKGKMTDKKNLPLGSLRDQITATKATGAFIKGSAKGTYDGLSAAEKRARKKK